MPVFVDTDEYGQIDLDMDVARLNSLREKFDCRLVEDCVQSIGACFNGTVTGSAGQMSALSFYPTRNLGALGDGGVVLTNGEEYAQHARKLRDYGQGAMYRHELVGYKSRLDELHAGLLRRFSLPRLPAWTETRRRIAAAYIAGIDNPTIRVPGAPPVPIPAGISSRCW